MKDPTIDRIDVSAYTISSDDREGLRLVRNRGPAGMAIAAGEYGYSNARMPPSMRHKR
jgi:hypothetical protein